MPLSKARDRERKRLLRLENKKVQPKSVPLYNPLVHGAGDTVRRAGRIVTIPELDADGNVIPEL